MNNQSGYGSKAPYNGILLAPFGTNSFIGVGNNGDDQSGNALPEDEGLYATDKTGGSYMYMKMDSDGETYPKAGVNQKIVYKSTFLPGIACFNWYEWTIANGNGNHVDPNDFNNDEVRTSETADDVVPEEPPTEGVEYARGIGQDKVINLNHKIESMGKKYAQATWIVTVEISLS